MRCDACGRFARHLNDVWANPPQNGIDREVCDDCYRTARRDEEKAR